MPELSIAQPIVLDLLDTSAAPALSSSSDMPIVETKPDATPAPAQEEAEAAAPEQGAETDTSESATEPETEPSANDEPKKAKGVQKRLDELTRQREEAARRAEAAEARLDQMLKMLERQVQPPEPEQPAADPEPVRPSRADYADPDQYEAALEGYLEERARITARREFEVQQQRMAEQQQANAVEQAKKAAQDAYAARVEKAKVDMPDFSAVAESPDVQVSIPMAAAILHSENGPQLQYYLGKNPAEAERIRNLTPPMQLLELGKLEAKLTAPSAAPAAKPAPVVSTTPPPIRPIASGSTPVSKDPNNMSMDEYKAWRKSQGFQPRH